MHDVRQALDIEAHRIEERPDALASLLRKIERRRRIGRATTAAVALLVAGAGILVAFGALGRPSATFRPAAAPFRGIWPQVSWEEAEVAQYRADQGDDRLTHQLDANVFVHAFVRDGLRWSDISFDRIRDDDAQGSGPLRVIMHGCPFDDSPHPVAAGPEPPPPAKCPLAVTVTIERLLRRDTTGIWFVTHVSSEGETPAVHRSPLPPEDETPGVDSLQMDPLAPQAVSELAMAFIEARNESRPVERYLSTEAKRAYERGDGGLSLYGYAAQAHSLSLWAVSEAEGGWRVVVGFQGNDFLTKGVLREALVIGPGQNTSGESLDWVILGAERTE